MTDHLVIAYGDANALRRGVAHAVLRDVVLHGPLDPGGAADADDVTAWIDAFAAMRGTWLADAFGVPADAAAQPIATALHAIARSDGRDLELVIDDEPCIDCATAQQIVAHVADRAGVRLLDAPGQRVDVGDLVAWRDAELSQLASWVDDALTNAAVAGASLADAWAELQASAHGTGLSDMGATHLFAERLAEFDAPAKLAAPATAHELVAACATGAWTDITLQTP